MPPTKSCPYCNYSTGSTNCLNPHVIKNHSTELHAALEAKYSEYPNPVAPFTIKVPKYDKDWIICLCCNDIWISTASYNKHLVESTKCVPGNQLIALQQATGLNFSPVAKEQTATLSIQKTQADAIKKMQNTVDKLYEVIEHQSKVIKKLQLDYTNLFLKVDVHACRLNQIQTPPVPQPVLVPPPKPVAPAPTLPKLAPPPISDSEEESEEDYESTVEEEPEIIINPKLRCKYAPDLCSELGDVNSITQNDIEPCLACKKPVCTSCIKKRGSRDRRPTHWYCSPACSPKK